MRGWGLPLACKLAIPWCWGVTPLRANWTWTLGMEDSYPSSVVLEWDNPKTYVISVPSGFQWDWAPVAHRGNLFVRALRICFFAFSVLLLDPRTGISWDHLPKKPLVFKPCFWISFQGESGLDTSYVNLLNFSSANCRKEIIISTRVTTCKGQWQNICENTLWTIKH